MFKINLGYVMRHPVSKKQGLGWSSVLDLVEHFEGTELDP